MEAKRLLILGSTSPTGKLIVQRAIQAGWQVTLYGRRTLEEHANNPNIQVFEGQLNDEATLRKAVRGQDVIISVIGPKGPFAPTDVFVDAYKLILRIMKSEGVSRIIALNTFSVRDSRDKPSLLRWILVTMLWTVANNVWKTMNNISQVFDSDGQDIDWTLFRVGFLADGPPLRVVDGYVGDGTVGMYLRRADVAEWTIDQAGRTPAEWIRERPGISSQKAG